MIVRENVTVFLVFLLDKMTIKIFSAQHGHKKHGDFQEVAKIKNKDFEGEIWIVAGFPDAVENIKEIYKKIVDVFKKHFFEIENEDNFERLEETLKKVNEEIEEDIKKLDQDVFRRGGIIVSLFINNVLHFTVCGTPEIYFVRKNKFTTVSEGISEISKEGEIFTNVASGELKDDDKIIFTTTRLLRAATGNQIADALNGGVLESIDALKLILPDDESFNLVVLHTKGTETLPFSSERKGFFHEIAAAKKGDAVNKNVDIVTKARTLFDRLFRSENSRKNIIIAFAALVGLVIIASFVGLLGQKEDTSERDQYAAEVKQIRLDLESLEIRKLEGKTEEANRLIDRIETSARRIEEAGYFRSEIIEILETVGNERNEINNITTISGPSVVADLKSADENIDLRGIFSSDGEQLVFSSNKIYQVLSASGEVKASFDIPEGEEIIKGVSFSSISKMIFLTKSGKILEVENGEVKFATTSDEIFKNAVDIATYSKYLYLLDADNDQIWKYESKYDSFTGAQEYNYDGDLGDAVSFAIDGNIFVLNTNGEIIKLYRGKKQDFIFKDIPDGKLEGITKVYTSEELDQIFLLDQAKNRILVFSKGANEAYYQKQIVFENTSVIIDFWVNPSTNRLFIIDQSKIYETLI